MSKIRNIFYVIVIRSSIFLGILLLLIANMTYIAKLNNKKELNKKINSITIINEPSVPGKEFKGFMQGIKDGLLSEGLHYNVVSVDYTPNILHTVKILLTTNTDRTLEIMKKCPDCQIIGFNFIDKNSTNYTGIYGGIPWDEIFLIYKKLIPNLHHLAVIYDETNSESIKQLEQLTHFIEQYNQNRDKTMAVYLYPIPITSPITKITHYDALYCVERDKAVLNKFQKIFTLCAQKNIPLIGGGFSGPQIGSAASITFAPYKIGRQISQIINKLDHGHKLNDCEIVHFNPDLYINISAAYRLGLTIPRSIKEQAETIYTDY
ncbi:MAG: ABC transporter substrate binding protein [bacterium]